MKENSETFSIFKQFHLKVQTQFKLKIKMGHIDNGTEYFSNIITLHVLIPHRKMVWPKGKNGMYLKLLSPLCFDPMFQNIFGEKPYLQFLINNMSSRVLGFHTPIHVLSQVFPHNCLVFYNPLRFFGCTSFVRVHSKNITKLDPRA